MKKKIWIILLMVTAMLLSACQPTPEKTIVGNKGGNVLKGTTASSTAQGQSYQAPSNWQETLDFANGKLAVDINAQIKVPKVQGFPIVESTPGEFTVEKLNEMIKYFAGDKIVYKDKNYGQMPVTIFDDLQTKSEIEGAILQLKLALSDPNSDVNSIKGSDPAGYQQAVNQLNGQIETLTKQLQTAPETVEQTPLTLDDSIKTDEANGIVDLGKARPAKIHINSTESENERNNYFTFENFGSMNSDNVIEDITADLRHPPKISVTDAQAVAQKAVSALAGNEMQLAYTAVTSYSDMLSVVKPKTQLDAQQYYVFYFTRSVNSVPYTYQRDLGTGGKKSSTAYAPPYPYEYIRVGVDDTGLIEFTWRAPINIQKTLKNDVALLPFDNIQDVFKQQIYNQQAWNGDTADAVGRTVYIDKITLGMMRVIDPDKTDGYLLIPVWDFFGYYADVYPKGYVDTKQLGLNDKNEAIHQNLAESMLTINAYNGTVIDRGAGY